MDSDFSAGVLKGRGCKRYSRTRGSPLPRELDTALATLRDDKFHGR